jgi:hypothetical protein
MQQQQQDQFDESEAVQGQEYQQISFRKIEELEQYGVNKADVTKLKNGGLHTIEAVRKSYLVVLYLTIFVS